MAILKLYPTKDTFISRSLPFNNYGVDEILQLTVSSSGFSSFFVDNDGDLDDQMSEATRLLIQFDTSSQKYLNATSGSCTSILTLYNCPNGYFTDENFSVNIYALTEAWSEGNQSVMYPATGAANYLWRNQMNTWTSSGGTYASLSSSPSAQVTFISGTENLTANISAFINYWNTGNSNNGLLIMFANENPAAISGDYFSTKTFFGKNTHTYYQPNITIQYSSGLIFDDIHNLHLGVNTLYVYDSNISGTAYTGQILLSDNLMAGTGSLTGYTPSYYVPGIWEISVTATTLAYPFGFWMIQSNTATGISTTAAFTGYQNYFQSTPYTSEINSAFLTNKLYFQEDTPLLRARVFKSVHRGMGSIALDYYAQHVYVQFREKNTFTQALPEQEMNYDRDGYFIQMDMSALIAGFYYVPVLRINTPFGDVFRKFPESAFYIQQLGQT